MILFFVGICIGFAIDHYVFQSGKASMIEKIEKELVMIEGKASTEVTSLIDRIRQAIL